MFRKILYAGFVLPVLAALLGANLQAAEWSSPAQELHYVGDIQWADENTLVFSASDFALQPAEQFTLYSWTPGSGNPPDSLGVQNVQQFTLSSEGALLAAAYGNGRVSIHDIARRKQLTEFIPEPGVRLWQMAFSADASRLLLLYEHGRLLYIDPQSGEVLSDNDLEQFSDAERLVFSPGGGLLLRSLDNWLEVWRTDTLRSIYRMDNLESAVRHVVFSPDAALLALEFTNELEVIRLADGVRVFATEENESFRHEALFSPDGKSLITTDGPNGTQARVWNLQTGNVRREVNLGQRNMLWDEIDTPLALSPDGRVLGSLRRFPNTHCYEFPLLESRIDLVNMEIGLLETMYPERHVAPVNTVVFSGDNSALASQSTDGEVLIWESGSGAQRRAFRDPGAMALSHDGERLYCAGNNEVREYSVNQARMLRRIPLPRGSTLGIALSPDDAWLFAGAPGSIEQVNLNNGRSVRIYWPKGAVFHSFRLVQEGARLVAGAGSLTVTGWNTATGEEVFHTDIDVSESPGWTTERFSFSADGKEVAGPCGAWSVESGVQLMDFGDCVGSAEFVGPGNYIWARSHVHERMVSWCKYECYREEAINVYTQSRECRRSRNRHPEERYFDAPGPSVYSPNGHHRVNFGHCSPAFGLQAACSPVTGVAADPDTPIPPVDYGNTILWAPSPNPMDDRGFVQFNLFRQDTTAVQLQLYDMRGAHMETLLDENLTPGSHTRIITLRHAPGAYMLVLRGPFKPRSQLLLLR